MACTKIRKGENLYRNFLIFYFSHILDGHDFYGTQKYLPNIYVREYCIIFKIKVWFF
jgi:hypothetical protein